MKDLDNKIVKRFGDQYVRTLVGLLKGKNKDASGALINSIDYRLVQDAEQIRVLILTNDYLEYVDKGRKPGKYPNISAIERWVKLKGIDSKAVWPIAHSIFKFGIKPTNVIEDSFKSFYKSKQYEDLSIGIGDAFSDRIIEEFKKIENINE